MTSVSICCLNMNTVITKKGIPILMRNKFSPFPSRSILPSRFISSKYCTSRNFRGKIFSRIWLRQTFREFLFSRLSKGSCKLAQSRAMSKFTIVSEQPSSAHFQYEKFIRNGTQARFFQLTSQEYTCITSLNK